MLWMLLVYVVATNGYNGTPSLTSGLRGATFATKDECTAAARGVVSVTSPGTEDIAKSGLILVCAPTLPPQQPQQAQADTPAPAEAAAPPPQPAQPSFPPYPPPPKRPRH